MLNSHRTKPQQSTDKQFYPETAPCSKSRKNGQLGRHHSRALGRGLRADGGRDGEEPSLLRSQLGHADVGNITVKIGSLYSLNNMTLLGNGSVQVKQYSLITYITQDYLSYLHTCYRLK